MSRARRFLIPEVIQTSAMDCGPASLKAVLAGFGINAAYDRLREACNTEVDGTSVDTIQAVAAKLGLEADQLMLPVDHLLTQPQRLLPALVVLRLPQGLPHFAVIWRKLGSYLLMMDPAKGRRWVHQDRLAEELYIHRAVVGAEDWREWAGGEGSLDTLRGSMRTLGCREHAVEALIATAVADASWFSLACLDAARRMVYLMVRAGALKRGAEAARMLDHLFHSGLSDGDRGRTIPIHYWSVRETVDDADYLGLDGAVLVTFAKAEAAPEPAPTESSVDATTAAVLSEDDSQRPMRHVLRLLRRDGFGILWLVGFGLLFAAVGVLLEALLFRALLTLGVGSDVGERLGTMTALLVFLFALLCLQLPIFDAILRLGRHLEVRLRLAILHKIPWLGDRYFHSRPTSDLAERAHRLMQVRDLPTLAGQGVAVVGNLLVTAAGMIWLAPRYAPLIGLLAVVAVHGPFCALSFLTETDLKVRTYLGSMGTFYLDALSGLVPIKAHGAERAVRTEHEGLVTAWARAAKRFLWQSVALDTLQRTLLTALTTVLVVGALLDGAQGGDLLLIYWALNVPMYGEQIAELVRRFPAYRNVTLRLLEPLGAPGAPPPATEVPAASAAAGGPEVRFEQVALHLGGRPVIHGCSLTVAAGEHIAVVGASGAGKSSLVGLLLGWSEPSAGRILLDGAPLTAAGFEAWRAQTAWVDGSVCLWNRSLEENIRYGTDNSAPPLDLLRQADLTELLETLPDGYHTALGEAGGLLSGGEGQRVRLARAFARPNARCVILDEPFRGLDQSKREHLFEQARDLWSHATMFCITHEVRAAARFPRVLVMDAGRVVEDGAPERLLADADSRFAALMRQELQTQAFHFDNRSAWRKWRLVEGRLLEPQRACMPHEDASLEAESLVRTKMTTKRKRRKRMGFMLRGRTPCEQCGLARIAHEDSSREAESLVSTKMTTKRKRSRADLRRSSAPSRIARLSKADGRTPRNRMGFMLRGRTPCEQCGLKVPAWKN